MIAAAVISHASLRLCHEPHGPQPAPLEGEAVKSGVLYRLWSVLAFSLIVCIARSLSCGLLGCTSQSVVCSLWLTVSSL